MQGCRRGTRPTPRRSSHSRSSSRHAAAGSSSSRPVALEAPIEAPLPPAEGQSEVGLPAPDEEEDFLVNVPVREESMIDIPLVEESELDTPTREDAPPVVARTLTDDTLGSVCSECSSMQDVNEQADRQVDGQESSGSSDLSVATHDATSAESSPLAADRPQVRDAEPSARAEQEGVEDTAGQGDVSGRGFGSVRSSSEEDADETGDYGTPVRALSGGRVTGSSGEDNCTFSWRIKNYTGLRLKKLFSDEFTVGGYKWRLSTRPKPNVRDVSIFLHLCTSGSTTKFPSSWSRLVQISFRVVNQYNSAYNFQRNGFHRFRPYDPDNYWGFKEFIAVDDLARGFLDDDDALLIEADVHLCKLGRQKTYPEHDSEHVFAGHKGTPSRSFSSYFSGWRSSSANASMHKKAKPSASDADAKSVESGKDVDAQEKQFHLAPRLQQHFICPITAEIMEDPVVAADGYTYERIGIEGWFIKHQTSPMTNLKLPHKLLVPNHTLRSAIMEWKSAQAGQGKQKS
ncbi:hypothetical protein CBR_g63131 [Chara braunii]|uniref:U-box domain-containing protein n=1 Tax=Chara braunii TaxID=69332 RepID=A0A388K951_CHABU|nr:hypothetical protein CBR_g63131 [Chara braunii]|eukprot:GBG66549.1 hypothetical protein CBR_g63131 [Chara braunii]